MTAPLPGSVQQSATARQMPIVQAGLIRPALEYARLAGGDKRALLRRARLPSDLMDQPRQFVPAFSWFELFDSLARELGQRDLGWRVATACGLEAYSQEFMAGISGAPTLLEAWRFVARAQSQHCNCQFFQVRVIGEFGYVVQGDRYRLPGYEHRNAFRTANIITATRSFLGDDWNPDLIITQTAPDVLPLDRLASVTTIRQGRFSAVRIPRAQLIAKPKRALQGAYQADRSIPPDSASQIKAVLRSYSKAEQPTLQDLAALMSTSARSLQRRLRSQQTSYSRLVREACFEQAKELLDDPAHRVIDIAQHVGYEDASHFSRMFRSMSGMSPSEYRDRLH